MRHVIENCWKVLRAIEAQGGFLLSSVCWTQSTTVRTNRQVTEREKICAVSDVDKTTKGKKIAA